MAHKHEKEIREFVELMDKARFNLLNHLAKEHGRKAAGQRARKYLTEMKKRITEIKRMTQEA